MVRRLTRANRSGGVAEGGERRIERRDGVDVGQGGRRADGRFARHGPRRSKRPSTRRCALQQRRHLQRLRCRLQRRRPHLVGLELRLQSCLVLACLIGNLLRSVHGIPPYLVFASQQNIDL